MPRAESLALDSAALADAQLADALARRRRLPAWALSAVLHAAMLLIFSAMWQTAPRHVPGEPDRRGGIVLVDRAEGKREYFAGEDAAEHSPQRPDQAAQRIAATPLPDAAEAPLDLAGMLPAAGDPVGGGAVGGALPDAGALTVGSGPQRGAQGETAQTQIFGAQGTGTKFLYVFDRSGSMSGYGGRPLRAAKRELLASLDDLDRIHQFQIIFYNHQPEVFNPSGGSPRLMWGDERSKDLARRYVAGVAAVGGTRHMEALTLALRLQPDVIFFLTDADEPRLSSEDLALIRRLNASGATVIHAIEFGYGPPDSRENFLARIARENHGQHVYVDIRSLRD